MYAKDINSCMEAYLVQMPEREYIKYTPNSAKTCKNVILLLRIAHLYDFPVHNLPQL